MYFACFFLVEVLISLSSLELALDSRVCSRLVVGVQRSVYVFCNLTFRDRSEVESRIPKPTSGHLDRVTCWCPEVGLGILDFACRRRAVRAVVGVQGSV